MDKYKNKKAELRAWAKDDIVPADLQWLCNATAEIIEQLQAKNNKLEVKLGDCVALVGELEQSEEQLQAENKRLLKCEQDLRKIHEELVEAIKRSDMTTQYFDGVLRVVHNKDE